MEWWQAFGIAVLSAAAVNGAIHVYRRWLARRTKAVGLIAEIESGQAELAEHNRLAVEQYHRIEAGMAPARSASTLLSRLAAQVEQAADDPQAIAEIAERLRGNTEALRRAVADNTPAEYGEFTEEWSIESATDIEEQAMPIARITAPYTVLAGDLVAGPSGSFVGVAMEAAQAGQLVEVQTSGYAAVTTEPSLPEIPLASIRSAELSVENRSFEFDVTTYGDMDRQAQVINGRVETIRLSCLHTPGLDYQPEVMLNGRRMRVFQSNVNAAIGDIMTVEFELRPADGDVAGTEWWHQVAGASMGNRTTAAFADVGLAGQDAAAAMAQLGSTFAAVPATNWEQFYTPHATRAPRKPRQQKAPEPEPTIRPSGGRRFDLEDE